MTGDRCPERHPALDAPCTMPLSFHQPYVPGEPWVRHVTTIHGEPSESGWLWLTEEKA